MEILGRKLANKIFFVKSKRQTNMFEVGSSEKKAKIFIKHKQSTQFWDLNVNMLVKQFFLNFQISVQIFFFFTHQYWV